MDERTASRLASGPPSDGSPAERLARLLAARPGRAVPDERGVRRAAVVLVLRAPEGRFAALANVEALFVRRADAAGDPWSGHIALPGGRAEPRDRDLLDTARRETREETSLDLVPGDFLGRLDDIRPVSPHLPPVAVTPFVAWLAQEAAVRESSELAGHLWVPLGALLDPGRRTSWRLAGPPERLFPAIAHGNAVIWGLTFRIVEDFLERVREGA